MNEELKVISGHVYYIKLQNCNAARVLEILECNPPLPPLFKDEDMERV